MRARARSVVFAVLTAAGCAGSPHPTGASRDAPRSGVGRGAPVTKGTALGRAWAHYDAGRYVEAAALFRSRDLLAVPEARLGLAAAALAVGDYELAATTARETTGAPSRLVFDLVSVRGEALRRQGKLDDARAVLTEAAGDPEARSVRLLLGEVLLESGLRDEAEPILMTLIEEYNKDGVDRNDGVALARVGRAAWLLGSPTDANDAFNQAEHQGTRDARVLLWRAEVFLESYDPGHAEEVLADVLARAPGHPEALARMAEAKLASNLDFEAAESLAKKALAGNPRLTLAEFVLGGVALRDMDFQKADQAIERGLATNPRDLDLLSLRAAVRFLADDRAGFERAKAAVLDKNPRYSRLYQIIGEYAEWEHRYEEIVVMMREALLADPGDAKVRAQLGFNLIRSGEEKDGVQALARAFGADPFNVRVFNTLNLYEKEIPRGYESLTRGKFSIRYHKDETAILDRYVPVLLEQAWKKLAKKYDFTPKVPVGIELYPSREHFAIRTSGLPQTFIQGVCFGRTLAAMSPRNERFNLGMTLWHELSHVFHIQLSKSRVPRWFTEGLAEYETLVERPEWRREHDAELAAALDEGRVPQLQDMNRAFSHAESMEDMATAYYASTQVVSFMAERWGMPKLRRMLELWGEGRRTPDVVKTALSITVEEVDRDFRSALRQRLARYQGQFAPPSRPGSVEEAEAAVRRTPGDAAKRTRLALALFGAGEEERAKKELDAARSADPKEPLGLWLRAQIAKTNEDRGGARKALEGLVAAGHDGYAVRMALADVAASASARKTELETAHGQDPLASAPLRALAELAQEARDDAAELAALRSLVVLEENDGESYRRLMSLLLGQKAFDEARRVGEAALHVDVESTETHRLYAEALFGTGAKKEALFELESAVRGTGEPAELAEAHRRLASVLEAKGDRQGAVRHRKTAEDLAAQGRTGPI